MVMTLAMDSPANEFGAKDLMKLGVFSKRSSFFGNSRGKVLKATKKVGKKVHSVRKVRKQEAFIVATAKVSGGRHGSNPFITVDVFEHSTSCGLYDWVFNPSCKAPETNRKIWAKKVVTLRYSFIHIFVLPTGWKNPRLTLPQYGKCGGTREAAMRIGSSTKLCLQADFGYRKCTTFIGIRIKCKNRSCPSMNLLIRHIVHGSADSTIPYVATGNGINFCNKHVGNLFLM